MQKILDLHIHSKYSRACSPKLTIKNIAKTCQKKGIDIVATGDFTFPKWFLEIKNELEEIKDNGLLKLKDNSSNIKFLLATELSLVYTQNKQCRRLHIMVNAPSLKAVEKLNKYLDKNYNIRSDGRPILGMSAKELLKICLDIHPKFLIYPAHIWTPWYAIFGSKSGFNSMEECFGDYTKYIYAYETGLSSDPEMNWRLSALDNYTLLSNSDAHSLINLGREANIFDLKEESYDEIYNIIKNNDKNKQLGTIEFYPEEGMYHYDGHRDCNISFSPQETEKHSGICPKCGKKLVVGVMNRVNELADRKLNFKPKNANKFFKLIELDKIIAESFNIKSRSSKKVISEYENMIRNLGSELDILMNIPINEIKKIAGERISLGIEKMRKGDLIIKPGFDGSYGEIKIFKNKSFKQQKKLFSDN